MSFIPVVVDLLLRCRKLPVYHLLFWKMNVPCNTPGHLHSTRQDAEKDEPRGTEGDGGNYSAREEIRVRKMQIVNKDSSVLRSAKWLPLRHSNPRLSPLKFTCRSGMQHKNVCCFIMLHAYTLFLINLFQTVKAVPCTNCPACWRTKREAETLK